MTLSMCSHRLRHFVVQARVEGVQCHAPQRLAALIEQRHAASDVVCAAADLCTAAATGCEETKAKLMEAHFPAEALRILQAGEVDVPAQAALCTALKSLITNDDERPPASQAFMHARVLALDKDAVPVFLAVLQRAVDDASALHTIISALQQLCANDEICIKVSSLSTGNGTDPACICPCVCKYTMFVQL